MAGWAALIEQADDSPVSMQAILASHQRRTMQRMTAKSTVLCVQDGTELNYSGLEKARDEHAQRDAHVNLRDREVELRPPSKYPARNALRLWVVHVHKPSPPAGAEPIEWFLITTCEITTPEQAQECLRWYCLRWRIEEWHRVLKSGCRIEALQHKTAERLQRAIAINLVIAWRIMLMTLLGRRCPDLPAEVLFSDAEIEVLQAYAKKKRLPKPTRLGDAVRLVAQLGGYVGRTKDLYPGHQIMWHGYSELQSLREGLSLRHWTSDDNKGCG